MTKRLIDIDDAILKAAQDALGVATIKETVAQALTEVVAAVARRHEVEWLESGGMSELADAEVRDRLWQR